MRASNIDYLLRRTRSVDIEGGSSCAGGGEAGADAGEG